MSKVVTQKTLFAAALLSAIGFATFASGSAEAASGNFDRCKANNKQQVTTCCDQQVKKLGKRPLWMVSSDSSCRTAVKCVMVTVYGDTPITHVAAPKKVKKCYIPKQNRQGGDNDNDNDTKRPDREPRSPNDPQTPGGKD